ncbi:MAG: methyltransferase domain-containing protein [Planctomycetes bacterium]|nr:methyltransferase domain-containing protein [Planctomycetota bacterium]
MNDSACCLDRENRTSPQPLGDLNDPSREVGQFIPLHYHFQMLTDQVRMAGFREAIDTVVKPGATVLEPGSGTGVLSYYAAQKAGKVYSVEYNGELVEVSRRLLRDNPNGDRVTVIHGDAFTYLPPEPVDAVICEMLHVGLVREKQLQMIDSFKSRYAERFPNRRLPAFIPTATIQAFQPVQYDFTFEGYTAAIPVFQDPYSADARATALGDPMVYQQLLYESPYELACRFNGAVPITAEGRLNALRFVTKNLLAIKPDLTTIDWHNQFLIIPLDHGLAVRPGQAVTLTFDYAPGDPLAALHPMVTGVQRSAVGITAA